MPMHMHCALKRVCALYRSQEWCRQLTSVDNDDKLDKLEREQFDVAVVDGSFISMCLYLIPHRLRIPWITYSDIVDPLIVRVPWLPSFVPSTTLFPFSEQMTFTERLKNIAAFCVLFFFLPMKFPDPEHEVMDKFRRYGYFNSLDELASKSALWFLTKDHVLDYPRPMMPNMVNIGGLTVRHSTGKLPPDIKNFIDGAKKGVILMTFGSMFSSIPAHMAEKFSVVFSQLDGYRVIWKRNSSNVELPDNVMISQWLPQNDILAHPAVKLFITHSGNNGQYEAVYHAVPMIGFPLYADQYYNAKRLDHKGYGLSMDLHDFTADQLLDNIHKILGDKSYKERVAKASEIFRSQPQGPVERATFWIEHVCRFGGDHLRSAGNDLPLYSYLMLDILAFILIILHILAYLLYRLLKLIVNKCGGHRHIVLDNELKKFD